MFARRQAMHPTDLQALVVVIHAERQGRPATASTLRTELGLTSGGITAVIDRLEAAGHVRRELDPADRRRHTLHQGEAARIVGEAFFGSLGRRTTAVAGGHSEAELLVIERYTAAIAEAMAELRRSLGDL